MARIIARESSRRCWRMTVIHLHLWNKDRPEPQPTTFRARLATIAITFVRARRIPAEQSSASTFNQIRLRMTLGETQS